MTSDGNKVTQEAEIPNAEGLHARPVMAFVDVASRYAATVKVCNKSRNGEFVDGKSAMQMMLLEGTQGCVLQIVADGPDASEAVDALVRLIESGFSG
ncbi:MAG: HPr family phosphocarrier protein [Phycisphaerae bacterium]